MVGIPCKVKFSHIPEQNFLFHSSGSNAIFSLTASSSGGMPMIVKWVRDISGLFCFKSLPVDKLIKNIGQFALLFKCTVQICQDKLHFISNKNVLTLDYLMTPTYFHEQELICYQLCGKRL